MIAFALAALLADPGAEQPDRMRRVVGAFAECLVNRAGYRLRPLLELPVGAGATVKAWVGLDPSASCLREANQESDDLQLHFKPYLMRGPVYEELYRKDFGRAAIADIAGVPSVVYPHGPAESSEAQRYRLAMTIGDCVVRAAPEASRALLFTGVTSPAEQSAMAAVVPHMSGCLPAGQTMKFSKVIVRGMIAEPIYRLTVAKRSGAGA